VLVTETTGYENPIVALSSDRKLSDSEREAVKGFYLPEGEEYKLRREHELIRAAAEKLGFKAYVPDDQLGEVRHSDNDVRSISMRNKAGQEVRIIIPPSTGKTGLHNGLIAVNLEPHIAGLDSLENAKIVHITSTHYGMMGLLNTAEAQLLMNMNFGRQLVVGDNQPGRTPDAHLHEIGFTLNKLNDLMSRHQTVRELIT
jgi:hypothetical protein